MGHIVLLVCFISFGTGFAAISAWLFLNLKYKDKRIKNLLIFLSALSFNMLGFTVYNYYNVTGVKAGILLDALIGLFMVTAGGLVVYSVPLFTYSMVNVEFKKYSRIFYTALAVTAAVYMFFINAVFDYKIARYAAIPYFIIQTIEIIYFVAYGLIKVNIIKEENVRKGFRDFLLLTILYIPIDFLNTIYFGFNNFDYKALHLFSMISYPLYYLMINIVSVQRIWKAMVGTSNQNQELQIKIEGNEISGEIEKLYVEWGITNREKEVIIFIMQGETNRAIADKLFLSVKTIDNHVYNIYKKTGAKNRIELSNMIKLK